MHISDEISQNGNTLNIFKFHDVESVATSKVDGKQSTTAMCETTLSIALWTNTAAKRNITIFFNYCVGLPTWKNHKVPVP